MEKTLRVKLAQIVNNAELTPSDKVIKLYGLESIAINYKLDSVKQVIRNTRVSLDAYATFQKL